MNFAPGNAEHTRLGIDRKATRTRYARTPHPSRDHRRMARHPAARGENTLCRVHPVDILRRRFLSDKDHRIAHLGALFGHIAIKHRNPRRSAR